MNAASEVGLGSASSDTAILDHLRRKPEATIADLADLLGVTATAVRQRLMRLMQHELVQRKSEAAGRGRPVHRYSLTALGLRSSGNNYGQLALALWDEVRAVKDQQVRQGLLARLAQRLAASYRSRIAGNTLSERMASLAGLMSGQDVPFEREGSPELPVLTALACPYPDLAERDRGVCAMENMFISEVLGEGVRLSSCRLDGSNCCTFEAASTRAGA
jgi:predicted ArsR family transcriptional regulator